MREFFKKFYNMTPMKYYDDKDHTKVKAQEMITNKDNKFRGFLKADGEWSRAIIMEDEVIMQSRSKSTVTGEYGFKSEHVPHITKELLENYPAGTILNGELSYRDVTKTSRDVGSILRSKAPLAIQKQEKEKLIFRVFDCLAYRYRELYELPFDERFKTEYVTPASVLHMRMPMAQYIEVIEEIDGDFMEYAENLWQNGGEGIIIVRRDAPYRPGKRKAWDSLKIKKKLGTLEAKVIGVIEPTKEYTGKTDLEDWKYWEGNLPVTKPYFNGWKSGVVVEYKGRTIKVTSGTTNVDGEWLSTNDAAKAIEEGSLYAEISGMQLTEDSIRHPYLIRLRTDL